MGQIIKNESVKLKSSDIELKGIYNFVTYVDKLSEKVIVEELEKILPEAVFIAEEDLMFSMNMD